MLLPKSPNYWLVCQPLSHILFHYQTRVICNWKQPYRQHFIWFVASLDQDDNPLIPALSRSVSVLLGSLLRCHISGTDPERTRFFVDSLLCLPLPLQLNSQMLILPPFQGEGHGAQLLEAVHRFYCSLAKVQDITGEDLDAFVSSAFTVLKKEWNYRFNLTFSSIEVFVLVNPGSELSKDGHVQLSLLLLFGSKQNGKFAALGDRGWILKRDPSFSPLGSFHGRSCLLTAHSAFSNTVPQCWRVNPWKETECQF